MSRQKYRFQPDELRHVRLWLLKHDYRLPHEGVQSLQSWCDYHLSANEWRRLQAALRQHRRDLSGYRTIRITSAAHQILTELSKRDKLTLSDFIEQRMSGFLDTASTDAQTETRSQPSASGAKSEAKKPTLKRMQNGDGWRVMLDGKDIGTVEPYTIRGYPKDRRAWRSCRPCSIFFGEHRTRFDAVQRLVQDAGDL